MAYVILDNIFSKDPEAIRSARLSLLAAHIDTHQPTLELPPELMDWTHNADANWQIAMQTKTAEWGEKEEAVQTSQEADAALRERYVDIKELLRACYTSDKKLEIYGIDGQTPPKRHDLIAKARRLVNGHNRLTAEGDPNVLPVAMIESLTMLADTADTAFDDTMLEYEDARKSTEDYDALFHADSYKLRIVFTWCVSMWGRKDTRLYELGFVPKSYGGGGGGGGEVPAAPTGFSFEWLDPFLNFKWDALESVTSYQIAFSEDGGAIWEELYTGEEASFEYEPPVGIRQYRVRARNADGYGDWSAILEYEVEGAPPMGEWPNELTGLYANYSDFPSPIIIVGHDGQTGADSYRLKRVKVLIGDPDPTDADMPVDNYVEGLNPDPYADTDIAPGDKCAYWACGVDAADVEGEWTGPAIGEYAE